MQRLQASESPIVANAMLTVCRNDGTSDVPHVEITGWQGFNETSMNAHSSGDSFVRRVANLREREWLKIDFLSSFAS